MFLSVHHNLKCHLLVVFICSLQISKKIKILEFVLIKGIWCTFMVGNFEHCFVYLLKGVYSKRKEFYRLDFAEILIWLLLCSDTSGIWNLFERLVVVFLKNFHQGHFFINLICTKILQKFSFKTIKNWLWLANYLSWQYFLQKYIDNMFSVAFFVFFFKIEAFFFNLCSGFTAQSTHKGHDMHGHFTYNHKLD